MRDKLNENPIAQVAVVGVLVAVALLLFFGKSGGGGEASEEPAPSGEVVASVNGATATGSSPGEAVENAVGSLEAGGGSVSSAGGAGLPSSVPAPPLPHRVSSAYDAGRTVVLLIVHDGGIDDRVTAAASASADTVPGTELFVVPARHVARYAAVTVGLEVNRVPALIVMKPRRLSGGVPQATVDYGVQTPQSVVQAVRDASYKGPEETYHPN